MSSIVPSQQHFSVIPFFSSFIPSSKSMESRTVSKMQKWGHTQNTQLKLWYFWKPNVPDIKFNLKEVPKTTVINTSSKNFWKILKWCMIKNYFSTKKSPSWRLLALVGGLFLTEHSCRSHLNAASDLGKPFMKTINYVLVPLVCNGNPLPIDRAPTV